jgi:hypothetical protein
VEETGSPKTIVSTPFSRISMKLSTELLGRESGFPNDAKMSQPFARLRVPGGAKAPICGAVSNGRSRLVRSSATHPPNGVVLIGALAAGVAHPSPLTSPSAMDPAQILCDLEIYWRA